jgi:hypothetical protein
VTSQLKSHFFIFTPVNLLTFMEPRNQFQKIDSASLCCLRAGTPKRVVGPAACQAGNRFLVALKGLQIRALVNRGLYVNYIKDEGLSYFIFKSSCPPFFNHQKDKMMGKKSFVHTLTRRGNGGGPLCVHCTLYYTANEIIGVPWGAWRGACYSGLQVYTKGLALYL